MIQRTKLCILSIPRFFILDNFSVQAILITFSIVSKTGVNPIPTTIAISHMIDNVSMRGSNPLIFTFYACSIQKPASPSVYFGSISFLVLSVSLPSQRIGSSFMVATRVRLFSCTCMDLIIRICMANHI